MSVNKGKGRATEHDKEIGSKVRCFRKILGLSQADLADGLGISYQQMQKYETGRNRLSVVRLIEICEIFEIDVHQFFHHEKFPADLTLIYDMCNQTLSDKMDQKQKDIIARVVKRFGEIDSEETMNHIIGIIEALTEKERA